METKEMKLGFRDNTDFSWMFDGDWDYKEEKSAPRMEIIHFITQDKRKKNENFSVLEVGCGWGKTLGHIRRHYPNAAIDGIEIDSKLAKGAESQVKGSVILNKDIDDASWLPYGEKSFDYIILADVLEHFLEPWTVLRNLMKVLKDDGSFLIAIPNFGSYMVLSNCLAGSFAYCTKDIINRGHLRFFMINDILDMVKACKLEMVELNKTMVEYPENVRTRFDNLFKAGYINQYTYENLDAYQFVFRAKKDLDTLVSGNNTKVQEAVLI